MITRNDILRVIRGNFDSDDSNEPDDLPFEFDASDAIDILEYLDVNNPRERVKMFNLNPFDMDDIEALANVEFYVVECDMCGAEVYVVRPDDWGMFQGIWTNGEIGPVDINGREKEICEECYESEKDDRRREEIMDDIRERKE